MQLEVDGIVRAQSYSSDDFETITITNPRASSNVQLVVFGYKDAVNTYTLHIEQHADC
jgi:hypothetical protein